MGLVAVVVVAGVAGVSGGSGDAERVTDESRVVVASGPVTAPTTTVPVEVTTTAVAPPPESTVPKVPLGRDLANGVAGDDVRRLQQRLTDLGFQPGPIDGIYGSMTIQAVWAFEKLVLGVPSDQATGRVTPAIWDRMQDPVEIRPRRPNPGTRNHTEIYLPEQVIVVFHSGEPVFVSHMSSGTGEEWCQEVTISPGEYGNENGEEPLKVGRCGRSVTPGGVFTYHRKHEGRRESALGGMLNPVYFNYGIAVHGAYNVPLEPASRGCVRIANDLSELFYSLVSRGERVFVWDGVKEPEWYGRQPPVFDWPDPEYTTTTTTTTTTVPPTTAPPTTVAESTTSVPAEAPANSTGISTG